MVHGTAGDEPRSCLMETEMRDGDEIESNPVITLTQAATGEMNVDNMGAFDWITLLFASCIIALAIVGGKKRTQSPWFPFFKKFFADQPRLTQLASEQP